MQLLCRSACFVFTVSSVLSVNLIYAAECTDAEWANIESIWRWAAKTSDCAQYAVGDSYVSAPCTATSCVGVMEKVGEELPDCTVSGVNNKIEVQNAMTACNNNDLIATDAPSVSPPTAAPLATIAPIATTTVSASTDGSIDSLMLPGSSPVPSSDATKCTDSQVSTIASLYTEAVKTSSCTPDATISSYRVYIYTKCASPCASKLGTLASDLPNCYEEYKFLNTKMALLDKIKECLTSSNVQYISTTVYLATTASASSTLQLGRALGLVILAVVGALL
ncbi:unnamed protein product [Peronospora destructor]|uniref:Elicitin-like protein n=1 Tax=Peronospora destructor TaxID=86335 RepID=A0AAV0V2Y4_9STRA|nr:unnamed protein product [Peronospora destructor]